jgi:cobalt-zinc-cadmium efflux system outer membrane protein
VTLALEHRPELAAQTATIAREETARRLARWDYLPDFEFAASRFVNFRRDDGYGAFAAVTIPLAYKTKYDAALAEADARLTSAQAEMRRLQDRIRRDVTQAFLRARTALLQHDLFVTTHIPQAEQALRVTESAYSAGAVEFTTLIDTARVLETTHLEHFEAAAEFEKASADLERAVGWPLAGTSAPVGGVPPEEAPGMHTSRVATTRGTGR